MRRTLLFSLACVLGACTLREVIPVEERVDTPKTSVEFFGLRTAVYSAADLAAAKRWYTDAFGVLPYFDEPYYVGFNVGGFELGIRPDTTSGTGAAGVAYWGVADARQTYARLLEKGATEVEPVQDVGGGVRIGAVRDPFGNVLGVVENPHFQYTPPRAAGPGR
jgi:predicted enzyme related to lactoylglutathione lyase